MAKASERAPGSRARPGKTNPGPPQGRARSSISSKRPRKPQGRTLREFHPLLPAERKILLSCRQGTEATISKKRPTKITSGNRIRAEFLRLMALGGEGDAPVHEYGISVTGGYIEGSFDLYNCTVDNPMQYIDCMFTDPVILAAATTKSVQFSGCGLNGVVADGCRVRGEFQVIECRCKGELRLAGASIEGTIDCSGARLYNRKGTTLACDRMEVDESLHLGKNFRSLGSVRLRSVKVGGVLDCQGGYFINRHGSSVLADGIDVGAEIYLSQGFKSVGEMRLLRCTTGGDLVCLDAVFRNKTQSPALNLRSANIGAGLIWRDLAEITGTISFDSASVIDLVDDEESLDKIDDALLDGFTYVRISGARSPTDAVRRIRWLKKQHPAQYGTVFWPQPWQHLARILREMGHAEDARLVAMEQQRQMRRLGVIGNRKPSSSSNWIARKAGAAWIAAFNGFTRILHLLYGALAGYGYRPFRTVGWVMVVWALAALSFAWADRRGIFVPTDAVARTVEGQPSPARASSFSPTMYALDVVLPLVDLQQESHWAPTVERADGTIIWAGLPIRTLMWFEILFGWVASLLLVSAVGRLVQKD